MAICHYNENKRILPIKSYVLGLIMSDRKRQPVLAKFFHLSSTYTAGPRAPTRTDNIDARESVRNALEHMFPGQYYLPLINQAIDFSLEIKRLRGISYDPLLYSDPATLICAYAEYNHDENRPDFKFKIEHLLAAIIAPFVRYDRDSQDTPEQQRQKISACLARLAASDNIFRKDKDSLLAKKVAQLVERISLVSEISLPWKAAMQETCSQDAPKTFTDFAHMVGEAAGGDRMVLAIRGMQKLLLAQGAIARADETLLHIRDADNLPPELHSLLNEIKSVYLPLVDAFKLKGLSSQFKESIFRLAEPVKYQEVLQDILHIAKRSVPSSMAKKINDWPSAASIIRCYYGKLAAQIVPEKLLEFVKIDARLKVPYSLFQKLEEKIRKGKKKPKDGPNILDIIAARIVVFCDGSKNMSRLDECSFYNASNAGDEYDFSFTNHEQKNLGAIVSYLTKLCKSNDALKQLSPQAVYSMLDAHLDPGLKYCANLLDANPDGTFVETYAPGKSKYKGNVPENSRVVHTDNHGQRVIRESKKSGYSADHTTLVHFTGKSFGIFELQLMTLTNYITKDSHDDYQSKRTGIPALKEKNMSKTVSVRVLHDGAGDEPQEKIVQLSKGATIADVLVRTFGANALDATISMGARLFSHAAAPLRFSDNASFSEIVSQQAMTGDKFAIQTRNDGLGYMDTEQRFNILIDACRDRGCKASLVAAKRAHNERVFTQLDKLLLKPA